MKKLYLSLLAILSAFYSFGQCYPGGIIGPQLVAASHIVTLVDSGNWYAGPTSIIYGSSGTWSTSDAAIATIDPTTGAVTGVSQGTVSISFTLSVPCASVAVRDLYVTSGTSGRFKICAGETTTLSNSMGGGSWSSSNPVVATINPTSGLVTGLSAGMSIISYNTIISGVPHSLFDTLRVVSITSIGSLAGSTSICNWDTTTIAGTTSAVRWTSTDSTVLTILTPTDSNVIIEGMAPGSAKIIGTSLYCTNIRDSITVQVRALPDPGVIYPINLDVCLGPPIPLTISGGDGYPGHWSTITGYVSIIDSFGMLTGYMEGWDVARYTVMSPNGCVATAENYMTFHAPPYLYGMVAPASIAVGQSTTLSCTAVVGIPVPFTTAWQCTPATLASITPSSGNLVGLSIGTATVSYIATAACGSDYLAADVEIVAPEVGGISSSFIAFTNPDCSSPIFGVSVPAHTSAYQLRTYTGDGGDAIVTSIPVATAAALTTFPYSYSTSGAYSIKQVLYYGAVALDSVQYTYHHYLCHDISLSFYADGNSNCSYDTGTEHLNLSPLAVEVIHNGIVIDTVPATSGLYYPTPAIPGDVYGFRIIGSAPVITCPSAGIIYDTILSGGIATVHRDVALGCGSSGSGYDLSVLAGFRAGRHIGSGTIVVHNHGCSSTAPSVVMTIDPHYMFHSSDPIPLSVVGNMVTWSYPALSDTSIPHVISYTLDLAGTTWLLPGFPVMNRFLGSPVSGDSDTSNNYVVRIDTVKSSFDPNHMTVSPSGNILNGTLLHYTVQFENDGNDTAHNIYVLDTLSDNLVASSLRIEGSSATMNTTVLHSGTYTILRFEFPNIMLPDSSHHNQCTGMFGYSIMAQTGLTDGAEILGHAGIYFDDNEVVLTDTAFNKIVVPNVSIVAGGSDSICDGSTVHFMATPHSVNVPHYHWYVNSTGAGTDSSGFVLPVAHVGDIVRCVMESIMDDTISSTSNNVVLMNLGLPNAGSIIGATSVCVGADISLTETITSGTWSVANAHASFTGGTLHGVSAGTDTVLYTTTNACGFSVAIHPVTINALPVAGSITGATSVCPGNTISLSSSISGGTWTLSNSHASHAGSMITGSTPGADSVFYTVSDVCGTAVAYHVITVASPVTPAVSTTVFPGDTVCNGDTVTFTPLPVNGGPTPIYLWKRFGTVISSGATLHYAPTLGDVITCDMISSVLCPSDDTVTSVSTTLLVVPVVTPSAIISTTIGDSISYHGQMVTINSTISYCGAGSYQWYKNGSLIAGATNATYSVAISNNDTFYCVNHCNNVCATTNVDTSNVLVIYGDYLTEGVGKIQSSLGNLTLYPNPNSGSFIFTGTLGTRTNENVHFDIMDLTGRVLYGGNTVPVNGVVTQQVDLAAVNIAAGHYILRVITGDGVAMVQFVTVK